MTDFISKKHRTQKLEVVIISLFWVLLFTSPILFGQFEGAIEWSNVYDHWGADIPLFFLFILNRFVLVPRLFLRNKKTLYIISAGAIVLLLSASSYVFDTRPQDKMPPHQPPDGHRPLDNTRRKHPDKEAFNPLKKHQPVPPYIHLLILSILVVGFDTGLKVSAKWSQLAQEKIELEKQTVENQLAFLRNQVSPHFFMNTLNNIHALIDFDTEGAKEAVIKLSKLMHHLLYKSESNLIALSEEVGFIKSYLELMQLRFSSKVDIKISIPQELPNKQIPPLLFTSLLENAFKHGVSYSKQSFIHIVLSVSENKLVLNIKNSNFKTEQKATTTGIGIKNTVKRLDLLYRNTYNFEITDNKDLYMINLSVPI